MTRLRLIGRIVRDAIAGLGARIAATIADVTDQEAVVIVGLGSLGWGLHVQPWDFGFASVGALLVAIGLGLTLQRAR